MNGRIAKALRHIAGMVATERSVLTAHGYAMEYPRGSARRLYQGAKRNRVRKEIPGAPTPEKRRRKPRKRNRSRARRFR